MLLLIHRCLNLRSNLFIQVFFLHGKLEHNLCGQTTLSRREFYKQSTAGGHWRGLAAEMKEKPNRRDVPSERLASLYYRQTLFITDYILQIFIRVKRIPRG